MESRMAMKENATWRDPALEAAKLELPQGRLRYFEQQRLPDRLPERAARERQPLAKSRSAALARGPLVQQLPAEAGPAIADAFGTSFWVAFALTAAALVPALLLPGKARSRVT
jgi:hypothetical protein